MTCHFKYTLLENVAQHGRVCDTSKVDGANPSSQALCSEKLSRRALPISQGRRFKSGHSPRIELIMPKFVKHNNQPSVLFDCEMIGKIIVRLLDNPTNPPSEAQCKLTMYSMCTDKPIVEIFQTGKQAQHRIDQIIGVK